MRRDATPTYYGTRQRGTNTTRTHMTQVTTLSHSLSQEVYTARTGAVRNTGVTHGVRCTVSSQSTKTPPTPAQQRENARFVCAPVTGPPGRRKLSVSSLLSIWREYNSVDLAPPDAVFLAGAVQVDGENVAVLIGVVVVAPLANVFELQGLPRLKLWSSTVLSTV